MKKGILNIVIGVAGSGKSTYINKVKNDTDIVISSDDIRQEIFGNAESQDRSNMIFTIFHGRIAEALLKGKTVWADATNLSVKARKDYLRYAKGYFIKAHLLTTPLEICIAQNNSRERKVPEDRIIEMFNSIEIPVNEPMTTIVVKNINNEYITTEYNNESYEELVRSV